MTDAARDAASDERLLAVHLDTDRTRAERDEAFRTLVTRYHRRVFAVCRQVVRDDGAAEEVAQEVFVRLARSAAGFRGDAKLSTWLYAVARNAATDRVRHEARRPATPVADVAEVAGAPTADDDLTVRETVLDVGRALARLDELSRELLWLVAVEGLSYAEAAAAHDLPVGTVKSRVSRARLRLGQLLTDDDVEVPAPTSPVDGARAQRGARPALPRGPPEDRPPMR